MLELSCVQEPTRSFRACALQSTGAMGESEPQAADELPVQQQRRENVIRLVFDGSVERFQDFCDAIRRAIPPDTSVVLRGSAVTGERWKDGARFDAEGSGTSDLDLTLVGDKVIGLFKLTGFFVPGVHSRPISEDDPEIAPELIPLREKLMGMVGRPVNIQASREIVMQVRGDLIGQPYLVLIDKNDPACNSES
jgi:predicted nucleotidyltransferase